MLGPLKVGGLPAVHASHFGVIPKDHHPGKWQLKDLSHPVGASMNDGIEPELCTLRYMSVDEVFKLVLHEGWNAEVEKLDVEST